jgi:hypothetical protein
MSDATAEYRAMEERLLAAIAGPCDFAALAPEVYRFQREHNPHYENWCRHLGSDPKLTDWQDIPAVPQSAFKRFALRSFPAERTAKTFRTSGTSGEGFGEHHFHDTRLYDAAIVAGWEALKLENLPLVILAQPPESAPHSSLSHMMGVLSARAPWSRFCMEDADFSDIREPFALLGTALAFLHRFERGGKMRNPLLRYAMETGGYKGTARRLEKAELYALFETHLGLPPERVVNEYGMTELSSQFYTHSLGAAHRGPAWARALVLDPATGREVAVGETGVLKILDLANLGSVLAVQTQDLAIRREDGFTLLGRDPAALPRGCSRTADEFLSRP